MKVLDPMNSQIFFCRICGIGENGNCTAPHVQSELRTPGSNLRAILIVAALGLIAVAVYAVMWWRG